jgi:hypothetical protein
MFLYIIELDAASATNGRPIASQVVGIHVAGCFLINDFSITTVNWFK